MQLFILLLIFFVPNEIFSTTVKEHCKQACDAVCARHKEKCALAKKCNESSTFGWKEANERQQILDAANTMRSKIATGTLESSKESPKAANMRVVSYSLVLEFAAQCLCNQCDRAKFLKDAECQTAPKHANLELFKFSYSTTSDVSEKKRLYDSFEKYILSQESNFLKWANSTWIGCGMTKFAEDPDICCLINTLNGGRKNIPPYEAGDPTTKCGKDGSNVKYPHLCGRIRPDFNFSQPFPLFKDFPKDFLPENYENITTRHTTPAQRTKSLLSTKQSEGGELRYDLFLLGFLGAVQLFL